jgi:hypothetical protein
LDVADIDIRDAATATIPIAGAQAIVFYGSFEPRIGYLAPQSGWNAVDGQGLPLGTQLRMTINVWDPTFTTLRETRVDTASWFHDPVSQVFAAIQRDARVQRILLEADMADLQAYIGDRFDAIEALLATLQSTLDGYIAAPTLAHDPMLDTILAAVTRTFPPS